MITYLIFGFFGLLALAMVIAGIIAVITVLIFIVGLNMTISMFPEF